MTDIIKLVLGGAVALLAILLILSPREIRRSRPNTVYLAPLLLVALFILYPEGGGIEPVAQQQDGPNFEELASHPDDRIHIVFSTSCTYFQQWQSEVLLHSLAKVGQRGRVTRLISGCNHIDDKAHKNNFMHDNKEQVSSRSLIQRTTNTKAEFFYTPSFKEAEEFKFANKPFSVRAWASSRESDGTGPTHPNEIIVLIDPDMILMAPLTMEAIPKDHLLSKTKPAMDGGNVVTRGHPVAAFYPIGVPWAKGGFFNQKFRDMLDKDFGNKDFAEAVCGSGSHCTEVDQKEGWNHYTLGPPYMMHWDDFKTFVHTWTKFTIPSAKLTNNDLIAEMWSFAMSAAHLHLPHTMLDNMMLSNPNEAGTSSFTEAWPWINDHLKHPMSCHEPTMPAGGLDVPNVLHYCQNQHVFDEKERPWMFHKGHVPEHILDCDMPLLKPPPDNLFNLQTDGHNKRIAFFICHVFKQINDAVLDYRTTFCPAGTVNDKKLIYLHQHSNNCGPTEHKTCFPLASIKPEGYDFTDHA
eukprot:m.72250 g.72250  ORF g.72250 m.72250 type:complete len:522 (-) comp8771_c0_seq2:86-1651(-)